MRPEAPSPSAVQNAALDQLLKMFVLEPAGQDQFIGQSLDLGFRNLFGGHILGQALLAAGNTCESRGAHSLHAYFLRGGNPRAPITYQVERLRDGHSFSVRRVIALQDGQAILILSASFQQDEDGFDHQESMPEVPPPEQVSTDPGIARPLSDIQNADGEGIITTARAIEIRPVNPVDHLNPEKAEPIRHAWFRAAGTVPATPALAKCLLAYASDFGLLATCMQPHGVTYYQSDMMTASLDHAMWFYRPFRIDDWLLYSSDSPSASHSRGLNRGNIFTRDGRLVACVAQEGLIRQMSRP